MNPNQASLQREIKNWNEVEERVKGESVGHDEEEANGVGSAAFGEKIQGHFGLLTIKT